MFLKTLSTFDEQVDAQLKKINSWMGILGLTAFIAFGATIFLTAATEGNPAVLNTGGALLAGSLVLFFVLWNKSRSLKDINLDNSIRKTLLPLLEILSEDISPQEKLSLSLNMGHPAAKENKISENELPPGLNRNLVERVYRVQTVHAAIPLLNGARLILDLVKQPASYDRYYRNARGKSKHKKKWKMLTLVTAGVASKTDEFAVDPAALDRLAESQKVKLKRVHGGQLRCLTRKFKSKSATGVPENNIKPDLVLSMFMELCATLKPAE